MPETEVSMLRLDDPVSYTHLDVYKRQTEAMSIRRRVKEARMRSSSARRSQISEFMSKTVILKCSITVNII